LVSEPYFGKLGVARDLDWWLTGKLDFWSTFYSRYLNFFGTAIGG